MKVASHLSEVNIRANKAESISSPIPKLFKSVLEQFVANETKVNSAIPKLPGEFKGLVELQRSSSALQLQVECISRVADSFTSTIKKVQQLGGQG